MNSTRALEKPSSNALEVKRNISNLEVASASGAGADSTTLCNTYADVNSVERINGIQKSKAFNF